MRAIHSSIVRSSRKLRAAIHRAILGTWYAAIDQHIAVGVGGAELIRPRPHAWVGLDKVVVVGAWDSHPLAAGIVFQLGNGIAL